MREEENTILTSLKELSDLDFSVEEVTARGETWQNGAGVDYLADGRVKNLVHIVTEGQRVYILGEHRFKVGTGTAIFIPDATRYASFAVGRCSGIGACFDFAGEIPEIEKKVYLDQTDDRGDYARLFIELDRCFRTAPRGRVRVKALLWRILDRMISDDGSRSELGASLAPALKFIASCYRMNLPVREYADACRLSESCFRRKFSEYTGMTPIEYRDSLRFDEARRLRIRGMSMTRIAETVGFCDVSYFRKLYKRRTGESITDYSAPGII